MSQKRPVPRPASRRRLRSTLTKLDLDGAFFWLLLVFFVTVFIFLSLRDTHIQLNPHQVAEYERRCQFLSNSTVYIVEVLRSENLLSKLSAADWKKVSSDIDWVAFVFDDLPLFLTDEWVAEAERELSHDRVKSGIGIGVFGCGCVVPNRYFEQVDVRLGGFECLLLPGWVLKADDVKFLNVGGDKCKRRDVVMASRVVKRYERELNEIRDALQEIEQGLDSNLTAGNLTIGP